MSADVLIYGDTLRSPPRARSSRRPATRRSAPSGRASASATGFFFWLGHGVGLVVHEMPALARTGHQELVAGDVVAVEPGVVAPAVGGMRVEDLVLVGQDGNENLTATLPYDLTL